MPPDVVLVSLAHYVSHARDSLVQPRGFGALRRRRRGGPPLTPAPFPLPPAAPRLVTRLAPCSHYLGPTRTASHPVDWVRVRVRVRVRVILTLTPAQGSSSLPTTWCRGGFPCLLRGVSPGPSRKACLKPDGESGTSGPDEGRLCGEDVPELALLGVRWRRGRTRSPPIRRGCDPHPSPTPSTKCMQINTNICNVSSPPGPAPARGECGESLAKARPPGGILQGAS